MVLFSFKIVRRLPLLISILPRLLKRCVSCRRKKAQFEDTVVIQIVAANTQAVVRRHERLRESLGLLGFHMCERPRLSNEETIHTVLQMVITRDISCVLKSCVCVR